MSSETIYRCDQCKDKMEENEFIRVRVELSIPYGSTLKSASSQTTKYLDTCIKCAEKLGFVRRVIEKGSQEIKAEPTTADKLYNLVADIAFETQQDNQY